MDVTPITPKLGAEVTGVDLAALSPNDEARIRDAFRDHLVLVFRDQALSREQHKTFGRLFGPLHTHPAKRLLGVPGDPEIFDIKITDKTRFANGEGWHSDLSCEPSPPLGSALYLKEQPATGGDTLFANMYEAYATLSEPMRTLIDPLTAFHDGRQDLANYEVELTPGQSYPSAHHPVAPVHPDSGKRVLFVNPSFTVRIEGLTAKESEAVLAMLYAQVRDQPSLQCRVRWQPGTLVLWDNRAVQHHAVWDYYPARRIGERVTIAGTAPTA